MRFLITVLTAALVLITSFPALAWNSTGHELSAQVAWSLLNNTEKQKISALLQAHPRFNQDFEDDLPGRVAAKGEDAKNQWYMRRSAVWPDVTRGFRGALRSRFHKARWHYINDPVYLTEDDLSELDGNLAANLERIPTGALESQNNVIQALKGHIAVLKNDNATSADRAVSFCWIAHLVGDIHQPLHSSALFSRGLFEKGDKGGNAIPVSGQGSKRNLHALWDSLAGTSKSVAVIGRLAVAMEQEFRDEGRAADNDMNVDHWLDESYAYAFDDAYDTVIIDAVFDAEDSPQEPLEPIFISQDYVEVNRIIARQRVVEAGYRLAKIIKDTF